MALSRPVGQGASARKYDLLTAIGAHGMAGGKVDQRLALRLITLITARYNWTLDLLTTGQREIARLWQVDDRTVRREMARLRDLGWLELRQQGARGRVSEYRLGVRAILAGTQHAWDAVGSDFVARMGGSVPAGTEVAPQDQNVIAFPLGGAPQAPAAESPANAVPGTSFWDSASAAFHRENPQLHSAWVRSLRVKNLDADEVVLLAPSRFHASYVHTHLADRLLALCRLSTPGLRNLRIEAAPK
ncbi:DnaA N-terminal domain-containing protein [Phaeovulum sp. W22_SRMD_FR3]|uniref:DnaA N-terminal domain-containing protein n=1 Tax=Phaeovulum sp. W22_SRMD_FR3 TaxID=3240274 RepID=UPI003F9DCD77